MDTITIEAMQETCEACIDRDLLIATMHQQIALLEAENGRLRQRISQAIRVLGIELLTK